MLKQLDLLLIAASWTVVHLRAGALAGPLDPRGKVHIPIGIANTLDTLKTFVEAEGNFSPGFATYGIYFWVFDRQAGKLFAPTMDSVKFDYGLDPNGYLMPWTSWYVGGRRVTTGICEVRCASPQGEVYVVGADVILTNFGPAPEASTTARYSLYAALRPLGPAGGPVRQIALSEEGDALLVDKHPALVSSEPPSAGGVLATDTLGDFAMAGQLPEERAARSDSGDCSGALRFDLDIAPGHLKKIGFVCPVLAGRRAVGHRWDGKSEWAQLDEALPNPEEGGVLQPDPGLGYYRPLRADALREEAKAYWERLVGRVRIDLVDLPDWPYRSWAACFAATTGHVMLSMNEDAPDVAVINYNVFNRDGVYVANILEKSAQPELAARALDHLLSHPFSGRVYPEADNPGQILWALGEHWLFTRDKKWLERVYPSVRKLAALIEYYRTTKGPHWVSLDRLDFGDALLPEERKELLPGRCDGSHPEYTEAFDIAGMRRAALLAEAMGSRHDSEAWGHLAGLFLEKYDQRFGDNLPKGYGSYSVLWPCRVYPLKEGKARQQFQGIGATPPAGWRYFPLATAHQGLLAGNREAGQGTLEAHFSHPQLHGWCAFDEGGKSGSGGWMHARTTWDSSVAMPHGWAIAELYLLLRDSLVFEDGEKLVLLAGVPEAWIARTGMGVQSLPTYFGPLTFGYHVHGSHATLTLWGNAAPPGGFLLRWPSGLKARFEIDGAVGEPSSSGDLALPPETRTVEIELEGR